MNEKRKILLAGGGTGGHAIPLIALYNYLNETGHYDFVWFWERDSIEEELALEQNINFHDISTGKIRRYLDIRNLYEPLKNLTWIVESLYYIRKEKIDFVFSKGGFVSLPVCIAAWILRKKIYLHESDSVTGLANKICSRLATKVFYSFPNDDTGLPWEAPEQENSKHMYSWHILNPELLDSVTDSSVEENENLSVLVIAGSQGSTTIFENLLQILPDCKDINFQVILWDQNQHFREDFLKFVNVKTHDFLGPRQLWEIMKRTDIAITRGSSTLWELYYFGIHSIIVPHKSTWGNHQYYNWLYFNANFGSDLLDEDENLHLEMFRRLQKYKTLRKSWLNLEGFFDGLKKIQEEIEG